MTNAAMSVAETVILDIIGDHPDLPIRADFYRGFKRGQILEETVQTPAVVGGWFVLLKPTLHGVVLSAWEPDILGGSIIGGLGDDAQVSPVHYPKTGSDVDLNALAGPGWRQELLAAIRAKAAVVAEQRNAVRN